MSKTNKELKELLKKLKVLAERGVGGEKETAQKKLDKLMKQNGLTEADLKETEERYYLFSYNGPFKKRLLNQIIYKVLGASRTQLYHSKGTRNKIGVHCTPAEKIEIELEFEFYSALFDEEVDILLSAFISKQDIYPEDVPITSFDTLPDEDREKFLKAEEYKKNITKRKRASGMIERKGDEN